jgi:hypothetical protein
VEYTFRSSSAEMPTTIYLNEYNLTIRQGKQETVIPYAGINEVILNKPGAKVFRTQINPEGGRPIVITNTYYTSEKTIEDRSRAYSTFVRVLHFHLKDKSKANFMSGNGMALLWIWLSFAAALAFLVALTAGYLGVMFINPLADGTILAIAFGTIVVVRRSGKFPRAYTPNDIPLEFLP